jgi:hypothetical protein
MTSIANMRGEQTHLLVPDKIVTSNDGADALGLGDDLLQDEDNGLASAR